MRDRLLTKRHHIIQNLLAAIAAGEKRTRKVWASDLGTGYFWFCTIVAEEKLESAIQLVRASKSTGVLQTLKEHRWNNGRFVAAIRVPSCAVAAAGFDTLAEVAYHAEPGRITLTQVAPTPSSASPEVPA